MFDDEIQGKKEELIKLDVKPKDYVKVKPSVEYDADENDKIKTNLENINEKLEKIDKSLESLKMRICGLTRSDPMMSWTEIIHHLREERHEVLRDFNKKTAEIVAMIALMKVISQQRDLEDQKIEENLKSTVMEKPLLELTGRYTGFRLKGDNLYLFDPYNEFPLNDLSTGAKDQVFLALRMGFCSRILKRKKVFFIFDDAFQYSDWDRRPLLVNKVVKLAKDGWQVLYFTMDDNIKNLFDEEGKKLGEKKYCSFELAKG